MGLSDFHKEHARKYFSERKPNTWNRGRFVLHCRASTTLNETQIGNAYRMTLHEIKMGGEKQQAARARELLLELTTGRIPLALTIPISGLTPRRIGIVNHREDLSRLTYSESPDATIARPSRDERRLERLNRKQQKRQDTIVQVGNYISGGVHGGSVKSTVIQEQKYKDSSPVPNFPEFDAVSSDSDLPPTEILSSSPNSTHSSDESSHPKTLPKSFPTPLGSLYPINSGIKALETNIAEASTAAANATQTKATQTNTPPTNGTHTIGAQTDAPEISEGERRQQRLRMEILELDVEFLRKRNAKLEERIDDLVNTIAIMQRRVSGC